MDNSSAASYVYAKASGLLSKAFVGNNAVELFNVKSLSELWTLLFDSPVPQVPESMLANQIENEAVRQFIQQYVKLLETYSRPDAYLIELLKTYEVENLKAIAGSLSIGEEKCPRLIDIGSYADLKYSCWPNLKKITENTDFSWYDHVPQVDERVLLDYQLDLQLIKELWNSIKKISDSSKEVVKNDFIREFSIKNMLWALRLKVYYKLSDDQIIEHLFYVGEMPSKTDPICRYAYELFGREPDSFEDWRKWRFSGYLNQHEEGEVWSINPMTIEQNLRWQEVSDLKKLFHQNPMTTVTLAMFFKLKKQEVSCIRAVTESIRLNADSKEAMLVSGVIRNLQEV